MAILTIMATGHTGSSSAFTGSTLGFVLLVIGLLATFLSGRRYLLSYLFAGMGYWVVVEGIQSILVNMTAMSRGYGYAAALVISWLAIAAFIGYRYKQYSARQQVIPVKRTGVEPLSRRRSAFKLIVNKVAMLRKAAKARKQQAKYIEHTPIYNNYKPRFRN